jgi:ferritin-like metal-binding protein YciE
MGGTSLIGSNPISIQRYGTMISYPGDTNILESISGYMTMLLSDINSVEKRLQEALNNMSNKYWYRDVLKWLELLFTIFKPNEVPPGISSSSSEVKSKFFQLEKILKNLYSKQLKIMMDSIQKSKILQSFKKFKI